MDRLPGKTLFLNRALTPLLRDMSGDVLRRE